MFEVYAKLIPTALLISLMISYCFKNLWKRLPIVEYCSLAGILVSLLVSIVLICRIPSSEIPVTSTLWNWIDYHGVKLSIKLLFDEVSSIFIIVMLTIGIIIAIVAVDNSKKDKADKHFFIFVVCSLLFSTIAVLSENFTTLFFGIEGGSLCLYWYAKKISSVGDFNGKLTNVFLINRICDFIIFLGFVGLAVTLNTVSFYELRFLKIIYDDSQIFTLSIFSIMIIVGCVVKMAQVSICASNSKSLLNDYLSQALIQTVVLMMPIITILIRLSYLFSNLLIVTNFLVCSGIIVSVFGGLVAVTQIRVQKILAYSTISQFGLIVFAFGVDGFSSGAFHTVNHAFSKVLLFLMVYKIVSSLDGEQNIKLMGGIRKKAPMVFIFSIVAILSLCGVPVFSGYFSLHDILWLTFNSPGGGLLYFIALLPVIITVVCFSRLIIFIFVMENRQEIKIEKISSAYSSAAFFIALLCVGIGFAGLPRVFSLNNAKGIQKYFEGGMVATTSELGSYQVENSIMLLSFFLIVVSASCIWILYVAKYNLNLPEKIKYRLYFIWKFFYNEIKIIRSTISYIGALLRYFAKVAAVTVEGKSAIGLYDFVGKIIFEFSKLLNRFQSNKIEKNILLIVICSGIIMLYFYIMFLRMFNY